MKRLWKALVALAVTAGLSATALIAAAPATAAPPQKPVCYTYTWNVETKVTNPEYSPNGAYMALGSATYWGHPTGLYISAQGDGFLRGRIAADFPLSQATAGGYLYLIEDNEGTVGTGVVGVIDVDLDANGSVDTVLPLDGAVIQSVLIDNPNARVKAAGFEFGPNANGYYWVVGIAVGPISESFTTISYTDGWRVTSKGFGPTVPADTDTKRYVVTSQTVVKCQAGKK